MMSNLVPVAVGFVLFALFAGFLAYKIAAPPMVVIIAAVLVMCLIDFCRNLRE